MLTYSSSDDKQTIADVWLRKGQRNPSIQGAIMRRFAAFLRQEEGATAVEYAVLLALILVVMMATITQFGAASGGMWGNIDSELNSHGF